MALQFTHLLRSLYTIIRFLQKILAYKGNDHLLDTHNIRPYSHDMKTLDTALKVPEADFDIIRVRIDSLETGKSNVLPCSFQTT